MGQPTAPADEEIGGCVCLGDDTDCDTCGSSYNHVDWYLDVDTGTVTLQSSIGCYSGDQLETAAADVAAAFLTDLAETFPAAAAELATEATRLRVAMAARSDGP